MIAWGARTPENVACCRRPRATCTTEVAIFTRGQALNRPCLPLEMICVTILLPARSWHPRGFVQGTTLSFRTPAITLIIWWPLWCTRITFASLPCLCCFGDRDQPVVKKHSATYLSIDVPPRRHHKAMLIIYTLANWALPVSHTGSWKAQTSPSVLCSSLMPCPRLPSIFGWPFYTFFCPWLGCLPPLGLTDMCSCPQVAGKWGFSRLVYLPKNLDKSTPPAQHFQGLKGGEHRQHWASQASVESETSPLIVPKVPCVQQPTSALLDFWSPSLRYSPAYLLVFLPGEVAGAFEKGYPPVPSHLSQHLLFRASFLSAILSLAAGSGFLCWYPVPQWWRMARTDTLHDTFVK